MTSKTDTHEMNIPDDAGAPEADLEDYGKGGEPPVKECAQTMRDNQVHERTADDPHGGTEDHHERAITIVVNGREKSVTGKKLTFAQLVDLAFDTPPTGENIVFTITYRRGHGDKPEGSLVEGEDVRIKNGMIFNVTATDKS